MVEGFGGERLRPAGQHHSGQVGKVETSLLDGVDYSLTSIAKFAGSNPPAALTTALAAILNDATQAQKFFADGNDAATAAPVQAGLVALRALRAQIPGMSLSDDARYEIDFRLKTKERDYEDAVLAANFITFDAIADDGLVIPGQPIRLNILAVNHGASDLNVTSVNIARLTRPRRARRRLKDASMLFRGAHPEEAAKPASPYFTDNYWACR